ncbi:MAG: discoidin domain-containing protein [Sedimentisphaerales bacterium]|nr:discoidin domain-containing protein [Sedimentisphaerales bacterium]
MNNRRRCILTRLTILTFAMPIMVCISLPVSARGQTYTRKDSFSETMLGSRSALKASAVDEQVDELYRHLRLQLMRDFPIEADWMLQDNENNLRRWFDAGDNADIEMKMIAGVLGEIGAEGAELKAAFEDLKQKKIPADDRQWLDLYIEACRVRRAARLARLIEAAPRIVFTKHFNMGGSHYAYTEAQSDAQAERQYRPGAGLCILHLDGPYGEVETLIDDRKGVIRDPGVSYDGKTILFSWKKSDRQDDYHLYEMNVETRKITQITSGLGFADYEADYLPNDDIIFNSTRCVQIVDCWWTEVSNLYTCDRKGRFLRRLTFDQVHTNFPTVLADGTVIYTRWDYNDRGQLFPQPLFQMNPDGTAQREFYGNNSWFPTTILHARGIPGTNKVIAIATGHHSRQTGKLIIVDPAKGRQENSGVQLIAPLRETRAERIDAYGQDGELFQYPYGLSETEYLVTYSPFGWAQEPVLFNIYYMTIEGRRELLASDPGISCNQPIPITPRPRPHLRPGMVDFQQGCGTYYLQDVYQGDGLKGIPRGTIKKLRVVEIKFRAAGVRSNGNGGPAGGALVSTPVAIRNGCWDAKVILGEAEVYEDGSACFDVPARTPVYFQAIDEKGYAVQSMRTWSTLQPGETFSCVGCHETKDETPLATAKPTMAMKAGPQQLEPFYGPPRGFSFSREIQPILDRHCTACHNDRANRRGLFDGLADLHGHPPVSPNGVSLPGETAFSLLDAPNRDDNAGRIWSDAYLALTNGGEPDTGVVRWLNVQSIPPMLPPYFTGAVKSPLIKMLEAGHHEVALSKEEADKIASWIDLLVPYCADYLEANCWTDEELKKYLHYQNKRDLMAAIEADNIRRLIAPTGPAPDLLPSNDPLANPYRNLAVNPGAVMGYARSWPHASSNSEYNNMPAFAARNAIDGKTENKGHGDNFPSWGPDKRSDLWWKVDFGRLVEIDKVTVYIRADFPHDDYWHSATIEFSDGTKEAISIEKTAEPQAFTFEKRTVSSLRLTDLREAEPLGWCGLTEVQVWGRDVYAYPSPLAAIYNP